MDTIEETRRKRLELLIKEHESLTNLADKLFPMSVSQISQWRNASPSSRSKRPRTMNSDSARLIEERLGKPIGWMDQPVLTEMESLLNSWESLRNIPREKLLEMQSTFSETKTDIPKKKSNG